MNTPEKVQKAIAKHEAVIQSLENEQTRLGEAIKAEQELIESMREVLLKFKTLENLNQKP